MSAHQIAARRQQLIDFLGLEDAQIALVEAIEEGTCFARKVLIALERGLIAQAA